MTAIVLSLLSTDLARTREFYEGLGFCLSGGDEEEWMELQRDGAKLQFYTSPPVGGLSSPSLSGTIYFHVEEVESVAAAVKSKGWRLEWGPETMDYDMREFGVRDPDGYLIAFASLP